MLKDARITRILASLRNIAAVAETHLESHWAEHVIAAADEVESNDRALVTKFKGLTLLQAMFT